MSLFSVVKKWFSSKKLPIWTGTCNLCGRELKSFDEDFRNKKVECYACILGFSKEGAEREADKKQIELIKRVIKQLELEKHESI